MQTISDRKNTTASTISKQMNSSPSQRFDELKVIPQETKESEVTEVTLDKISQKPSDFTQTLLEDTKTGT